MARKDSTGFTISVPEYRLPLVDMARNYAEQHHKYFSEVVLEALEAHLRREPKDGK